jgi:hypothetical protein
MATLMGSNCRLIVSSPEIMHGVGGFARYSVEVFQLDGVLLHT